MMKTLYWCALILTIIGALNWGLVGAFDFNLVTALFGNFPLLVKLINILVGASALLLLISHFTDGKMCGTHMHSHSHKE